MAAHCRAARPGRAEAEREAGDVVAMAADGRVRDQDRGGPQAMASPSYGIDLIALAYVVILASAVLMISSLLLRDLADLMPPPLSGVH